MMELRWCIVHHTQDTCADELLRDKRPSPPPDAPATGTPTLDDVIAKLRWCADGNREQSVALSAVECDLLLYALTDMSENDENDDDGNGRDTSDDRALLDHRHGDESPQP